MIFPSANWVNHLQPLYIAGQVFGNSLGGQESAASPTGDDEFFKNEQYASEKLALLKHLAKIERETGWKTSARASELRNLWGFG